ncbi:MAG TPA: NifB/NifX family molybdenum-iron cluster-binding protein [Bacteroidales bacterium]|mgnify:CR=1 FL=1|jgi:predicted Fe-Mo cluster-binding NifX family protein|nr:NifB/NifX family molybdenum-iron cluster-binding protein [Bacteroidales bacterium]
MKKFAIPLENGNLCAHFGHCKEFALIDVEDQTIKSQTFLTPPPHEPGLLPAWLAEKGVTHIIAGGMGQRAINLFKENNIQVCVGAESGTPEELVGNFLSNALKTGANLCDH